MRRNNSHPEPSVGASLCGSELARDSSLIVDESLADTPQSRASSLPQEFCEELYSVIILCQSSPIAFLELSRCCL
ncbi:hypothetical protein EMIT043CA1_160021 [Pseudomonas brassicacearum]